MLFRRLERAIIKVVMDKDRDLQLKWSYCDDIDS